jgi:hypothetical protein
MKTDQEIINQIRVLKEIKPEMEWAILAKQRIMGLEAVEQKLSLVNLFRNFTYQYRVAFAGILLVGLAGGTIAASQNALPGEPLYAVKRTAENGLAMITGNRGTPEANLRLATKRLEEINLISQKNLVKNLPQAFKEYETAKTAAKKEVAALIKKNPSQAGAIVKQVALTMQDIDNREKQVYGVLGLEQNTNSVDGSADANYDKTIVESLINYFKKDAVLSDSQNSDLAKVKELYDAGNYSGAIDYYLNSSLNK